jgi:hypothetical protein
VAVLGIVTELVVARNYGLALLFITPMAMLMGQLADPRPIGPLLFDRGVETVIGASIGGLIVLDEQLLRRPRPSACRLMHLRGRADRLDHLPVSRHRPPRRPAVEAAATPAGPLLVWDQPLHHRSRRSDRCVRSPR